MWELIKDFVHIVSETLPIIEPIYEFDSLQVSGQEGFADLRQFLKGKGYVEWKQYYTTILPRKAKKGLYKGYGYHQEFRARMGLKYKKALELTRADQSILEIGCHTGYFGEILEKRGNKIWGIEINIEAANKAEPFYEKILVGDIEDENLWNMIDQKFDVILFMDVLEHLVDPWRILIKSRDVLNPDGFILITLPNIAFYRIRKAFFFGRFDYQESGILDATHLRFFTFNSARRLFEDCRYIISEWHIVESELPCEKRFPSISGFYNVIRPYLIKRFPNLFGSVILFKLLPRKWF